jgi:glycosyl transferase family 25
MFEQYDAIRVINLPERTDRKKEMLRELRRVGLEKRASFFPACRPSDIGPFRSIGEYGVFLSHLAILQESVVSKGSVLILEDDCDFTRASLLKREASDFMWGGYTLFPKHIEGAHCVGFSAPTVERLVPYLEDLLARVPIPIDGAYAWFCRDNPDLRVDACSPAIAVQRPSHSDIAGRRGLDRFGPARPLIAALRKMKRRLRQPDYQEGSFDTLMRALRDEKNAT